MSSPFEKLEEFPAAAGEVWLVRERNGGRLLQWRQLPLKMAEADWQRLQEAARPLLRPPVPPEVLCYQIVAGGPRQLVRPWVRGFNLQVLLAERRRFSPVDVLELLARLAPLLDALAGALHAWPRPLLDKLFVEASDIALRSPVSAWRAWRLLADPLRASAWLPIGYGQTIPEADPADGLLAAPSAGYELVRVAAQLLGLPKMAGRRFAPLPALRETGNDFLRASLEEPAPLSAARALEGLTGAFMKDGFVRLPETDPLPGRGVVTPLPEAQEAVAAPAAPGKSTPEQAYVNPYFRRTPPPVVLPQRGTSLRLHVSDDVGRSVRVASGPRFRLGRSPAEADCVLTFLPSSERNKQLTQQLSRVHVIASLAGGRLGLHDGNGTVPSRNGSSFCGQPLSAEHASPLDRDGEVSLLSGQFRVSLRTLAGRAALHYPPFDDAPPGGEGLPGAVWFHVARELALHDGLWLLSSCGLALDQRDHLAWCHDAPAQAPVALWRSGGGFCIANRSLAAEAISIDQQPLEQGAASGLVTAQILRLGRTRYRVSVLGGAN